MKCNVKVSARRVSRGLPPEVHPLGDRGPVSWIIAERRSPCIANGHSIMVTPNRRPEWQDPGTRGMRRIESATEISSRNNPSFNFYPNLVAPVDPSGVPFLLFLAHLRHHDENRMSLVCAGLGWWTAAGTVENAHRQFRSDTRRRSAIRPTDFRSR